jgi:predicted nuclease of predicted toxin-antitoxin system
LKKPSAAKPPERLVFFVDRSLGKHVVPDALRAAGYSCEIHDDHFQPDTEDQEWLRALADLKWVVLTKDERIRYRPLELNALREAALRVFIVICGNVTGKSTAEIIVKAMPRMLDLLRRKRGSFVCYVYKDGTIKTK